MEQREVPADLDAEESVLGALLLASTHEENLLARIRAIIQPRDFYRDKHGWIFAAMLEVADKGCGGDPMVRSVHQITVTRQLAIDDKLKACGGAAYISHLIANCPTTVYAEDYARIVRETAMRRGQIGRARQLEESAYQGKAERSSGQGVTKLPPKER